MFESRSTRTLRQAQEMLDTTHRWVLLKQQSGGLNDVDRKQVEKELDQATVLYDRSLNESNASFLGDMFAAVKLLFREGRLFPTEAQLDQQYRELERQKDELLKSLKPEAGRPPSG